MFPESKITEIYYMADDFFARNLLCNRKNI